MFSAVISKYYKFTLYLTFHSPSLPPFVLSFSPKAQNKETTEIKQHKINSINIMFPQCPPCLVTYILTGQQSEDADLKN